MTVDKEEMMERRQAIAFGGGAVIAVAATLVVSGLLSLAAYDPTIPRPKEAIPTIGFEVNMDEEQLVISPTFQGNCNQHPDTPNNPKNKGCFRIKKNSIGLIKFEFTASDDWVLKQFTICRGDSKIKTSCDDALTIFERLEFFVMNDDKGTTVLLTPGSGVVDLNQLPDGDALRTFYLFDQNTIKGDYFYNIEACNTTINKCWTLDPPVENKGLPG